ncbi:Bacterial membrane flanked domain-containing protein [Acidipropionibacterium acidipropionici ATCC 4875]|uniref:Bacterial membrane flanked domain-containing protein n=1 Tax=Acidipropionibacterium acidipropionici (strain ATCC 4875 / DSM 20272 / JCM 6432 / NBRC 12425 / NCIMB 8070 / 4) TaxID=1171373 RepID=K7RKN9_ACIA4|nr:PH domain-containing protein [Acidipropionibacterium acidipropionici]AFV88489.1 Bacterial membrane flanked domain-containing protein [Acidipropionibacterium acidipropionici ATCC 4875]
MTTPEPGPADPTPTDPVPTDPAPTEQRPHWATPIIRGWLVLAAVAVASGQQLFDNWRSGDGLPPVGALLIVAGIVVLVALIQGVIGYFQWRTTRFRIDEEEVRVDRNFIQHSSDRLALSKIQSVDVVQPLAARVFGLARLHIDIGGSKPKTIEYLTRADAYRFRDFLTTRAHAAGAAVPATGPASPGVLPTEQPGPAVASGSAWQDRRVDEETIVSVSSRQVVLGTFVSGGFLFSVLMIAVGIAVPIALDVEALSIPVVLGGLVSAGGVIARTLVKYWRFTLLRSSGGLKAVHGLTTLTTRTVPVRRVQGIVVSQPLMWRITGLYSVRMTVLGVAGADNDLDAATLLPMGSADQVRGAVAALWPGFDVSAVSTMTPIPMAGIPARARWLRWFDRQTFTQGMGDRVIVARRGLMRRVTAVVPHSRAQSVRLDQGPLQRRLRLATLSVHIPGGPVHLDCPHLDAGEARTLLLDEMDRCRAARAAELGENGAGSGGHGTGTVPSPGG